MSCFIIETLVLFVKRWLPLRAPTCQGVTILYAQGDCFVLPRFARSFGYSPRNDDEEGASHLFRGGHAHEAKGS
jgi:hypothetical protein